MSDEPIVVDPPVTPKASPRQYSDEERNIALATVDLCAGNVHRASIAAGIPATTLYDWVHERTKRKQDFSEGRREKRGDLSAKMESVVHSLVESMPAKIGKATLSQTAVATGILTDKIRILRGQGLEPDPAMELCRLLGINRSQLPDRLELLPGDVIPPGFASIIDIVPEAESSSELSKMDVNPSQGVDGDATDDRALLAKLDDDGTEN
jgi:transposase-like protein